MLQVTSHSVWISKTGTVNLFEKITCAMSLTGTIAAVHLVLLDHNHAFVTIKTHRSFFHFVTFMKFLYLLSYTSCGVVDFVRLQLFVNRRHSPTQLYA